MRGNQFSFILILFSLSFLSASCGSETNSISRTSELGLGSRIPPQSNDITVYLVTGIEDDGSKYGLLSVNYIPGSEYDSQALASFFPEGFQIRLANQNLDLFQDSSVLGTGIAGYSNEKYFRSEDLVEWAEFISLHSAEFKIPSGGEAPASGWPKSPAPLNDLAQKFPALEINRPVLANCLPLGFGTPGISWTAPLNQKGSIRILERLDSNRFAYDIAEDSARFFKPAKNSALLTQAFSADEFGQVEVKDPITGAFKFFEKRMEIYLERSLRSEPARFNVGNSRIDNIRFQFYIVQYAQNWRVRLQGGCGQ